MPPAKNAHGKNMPPASPPTKTLTTKETSMIRFLYRLNQFPLVQLILSLMVLVCMLAALYGVVSFIHAYIGDWYFIACAVSMIFFLRMAKNAPLESELWPDKR